MPRNTAEVGHSALRPGRSWSMLSVRRKTPSTELEYRARQRLMPTVFTGLSWTCPHKPIPQAQDIF